MFSSLNDSPAAAKLTPEERLSGDMLLFSTALMSLASMLWLAIYWSFGIRFSTAVPLTFLVVSAANMFLFIKTRRLALFCYTQLVMFLFTPFVMQWAIGNFVSASGVSLWALLAPIGAIVILGTRESVPWFIAYILLTAMSGMVDYIIPSNAAAYNMQTVAVFFALNFVSISAMVYVLLWYFSREKAKLRGAVEAQTEAVAIEKELAERLLLNILPAQIAERLKRQETSIADGHTDVVVMFADIVNFTHLSEEMSPNETVHLLNDLFSEFDLLAEKHGIEKIKTIGDAYMAAGGLRLNALQYVDAMADMAMEIQGFAARYIAPNSDNVHIRIGIATGPVVAGVIGRRKFSYDLWGDTVNTASRLAGEAQPGGILVDTVTYRRIHNRYRFDELPGVQLKGKGQMKVYQLRGRAPPTLGDPGVRPQPAAPAAGGDERTA
ncbi:MAG TPA: adenylate/guanylate cyclase domain-containing protein [Usitatibacteraceae bacterium]|nr:adenylate/guanylate cyclase domain-containing protein [Usitatibacteraceae bacterium]